nr:MAG TPA: hypothetical protein [Caudoviricetes sp.]DAV89472.1 MAG TPA: hypothetical protein [Caudoviricetes sp.]
MYILRVQVLLPAPSSKTAWNLKSLDFMRFFLYFLSKIFLYFKANFYGIKPFFIKMQHDMQHAYYPSAKSISKKF